MNELEKILEEIEEEQRSYEADHAWNYAKGLEYAAEIIRKHMNAGWIPGKEKPAEDGFYVATMSGTLVDQKEPFVGLAEFEDGNWADGDDVIAWRPLPEPYKPKENEDEN